MGLIKKKFKFGNVFISDKTYRMAIETDEGFITDEKLVGDYFEKNRIPIKVQFELTEKCNFRCYYCYAENLRKQGDLELHQIKKILDQLHNEGVIFLEFTGGEIMIRPDFIDIIEYAREKEFIISLYTNGSYLNNEILNVLKKAKIRFVALSLLSPVEEKCDKLTNHKGSFKKILRATELLKANDVNFMVSCVLTSENIDDYKKFEALNDKYNLNIQYGFDVGPTFEGYSKVDKYSLKRHKAESIDDFLVSRIEQYSKINLKKRCGAGQSKFAITSEGDILPCLKYRSVIGNILKDSFKKIWDSERILEIVNNDLKRDEECFKCKKKEFCFYCPGEMRFYENKIDKCKSVDLLYNNFKENCNVQ